MTRNECEKAVDKICEKCFKKHELEYGHQPINCAYREFDNEDCPTVKVLKDLIQEHFGVKENKMKAIKMFKSLGYEYNKGRNKNQIIEYCKGNISIFFG